jgi:hypothetical protein
MAIALVATMCMTCDASTCTSPPFDLVSWWPGNGNADDFFGVHQGALHGNTSFVPGMVDEAFDFDGEDDYVSVPDDPAWDLGLNDFTIDFWVLLHQIKNSMFIHQQSGSSLGGFEFDLQPPSGMLVFSRDGAGGGLGRSWVPQVETWYHLAVTRTAGTYRLYVNGSQLGSAQSDPMPVADVTGPLRIGGWAFGNTYDVSGLIDELEIVHRALSSQEIADIHDAGSAGKCATYAARVQPSQGGNAGAVTVSVQGLGFQSGAQAKLTRSGQSDIIGTATVVSADGLSLTTTIDLTGKLAGGWNVVVTNLDASYCVIPQGFLIEEAAAPQLRVSVIGRSLIRSNRRTAYDVVIENPGNMDAGAVPVWLTGIPLDASVDVDFPLSYPPRDAGEPDWSTVPLGFTSSRGRYVPLVIPRVPPGTTVRRIHVTVPPSDPTFTLGVATTPPWADGNKFRSCLGAVVSAPACMGSQLTAINAYLAGHPEVEALSGVGVWAKEAWQCEGAATLPAALTKAEQVLDYMVGPVEVAGSAGGACGDVLPPRWRDTLVVTLVGSIDPNAKLGSQGTASVAQAIPYSILFENLNSATAPAQQVVVSDPLNVAVVDPATVSLDAITFGNVRIVPPPGLRSYATQVDLRPAKNLLVNVSAAVDLFTGVLSWYFSSIDPTTGQPPSDPLAGFLPPNVTPPQGEGSVLFTVMPRPSLVGGTVIGNGAAITFDENAPMSTGVWQNTVEVGAPGSHVLPIAGTSDLPSFPVQWTAEGSPSDLKDYTVYVSEDGSPYRVWRQNTMATGDTLVPAKNHVTHTYAFYSVARDVSGNVEAPPGGPDATTLARTGVEPVGGWRLSLEGARPNPTVGAAGLHVWFTLPSAEPASLEVTDVAGRRVARQEVGLLGAGSHRVTLPRSPRLPPGLYFLRLTQGTQRLSARVVAID